jgi:hypothetical protein
VSVAPDALSFPSAEEALAAGGTLEIQTHGMECTVLTVHTEVVADSAAGLEVEIEVASHLVAADGEWACDLLLFIFH